MQSQQIADFLERPLVGENLDILSFSTFADGKKNSVIFINKATDKNFSKAQALELVLALVPVSFEGKISVPHIIVDNPRLAYARVLTAFFLPKQVSGIHPSAIIEAGAEIGSDVFIGANCYIGSKVKIGDRTYISPNVVLDGDTVIGQDCLIKSGVVIGQSGFGFEKNEEGIYEYFPQLGNVIIGNHVYIGANTCVDRAALGTTRIGDHVKIDNLTQIAHNVEIGNNTIITSGAAISGSVTIGKDNWIAPNVTIKEKLHVGDACFVGMGSVVIKNVKDKTLVFGNPARELKF